MGDLIPDAQVNGLALSSFIALICKSDSAVISAVSSKFFLMAQRYTVFLNERAITICSEMECCDKARDLVLYFTDKSSLDKEFKRFSRDSDCKNLIVIAIENFEEACVAFNGIFKRIEAAGGIVRNKNQEYLFIKRLGVWDLPKGKLHKNESIQAGALREVEEETGLSELKIVRQLPSTFHIYTDRKGLEILKETYWFEMKSEKQQELVPQHEEDITEARWFTESGLEIPIQTTYASLRNLMKSYLQL